jgi:ferredoxin-thioredoxin reductase catalytic chain
MKGRRSHQQRNVAKDTMADDSTEAELLKWARRYARKHGWVLNTDEKQLATVIRGLARNKTRFGRPYCPCRLRSGDEEKDRAIECPCVYHKDEIANDGSCHCKLYFSTH